jgi:hypothetical protein
MGCDVKFAFILDGSGNLGGNLSKSLGLSRGNPSQVESVFPDPGEIQQLGAKPDFLFSVYITFQVMAVADVSTGHQHTIRTLFKGADNEHRVHPSGTHDPNGSQVGRVLQPGDAG